MKALHLLFPVALAAWPIAAQDEVQVERASTPKTVSALISSIEADLTAITGLGFHKDVPYAVIGKAQLRAFLEARMKDAVKPEEIHAEETTLKMFGFLPPDFDLKKTTVELLTEQAAAFYDYHKKRLFILETGDSTPDLHTEAEKMALAHELGHALADQHFRLEKYIREGAHSDDGSSARLAVMEGQASWLMTAYLSKAASGQAEVPPGVLEMMSGAVETSASQYPVFSKAPLYLRESLVFPYTTGMLFQNAVYRKLGRESFAEVFQRPPLSTQQIIHPEKYLEHVAPDIPVLPAIPDAKRFHKVGDGTLGEFDFRVLLQEYAGKDEAAALAPHATGGMYELLEAKHDRHPVLAFAANWDTADSARAFFGDYRKVLSGKSKSCTFDSESAMELAGRNEYGYFRVRLDGKRFESVEGLLQLH
jgi:hypothetical protein